MDKKFIAGGAFGGLVLASALVGTVSAQSASEATGLSIEQAIEIALLEVPGEIQEIELEREDGEMIYEVEILDAEGQEFEIEIAADTGEIIEVEAESDDEEDDDDREDRDDKDDD